MPSILPSSYLIMLGSSVLLGLKPTYHRFQATVPELTNSNLWVYTKLSTHYHNTTTLGILYQHILKFGILSLRWEDQGMARSRATFLRGSPANDYYKWLIMSYLHSRHLPYILLTSGSPIYPWSSARSSAPRYPSSKRKSFERLSLSELPAK